MSHESIHEQLLVSARKWARTAVEAYLDEPIDQDFAVHHMAVAVEHTSKAYLASISAVLLASEKQLSVDDLLVLSGNEDRTQKGRAGLKTIGGEGAILRAAGLLGRGYQPPAGLKQLREPLPGKRQSPSPVRRHQRHSLSRRRPPAVVKSNDASAVKSS